MLISTAKWNETIISGNIHAHDLPFHEKGTCFHFQNIIFSNERVVCGYQTKPCYRETIAKEPHTELLRGTDFSSGHSGLFSAGGVSCKTVQDPTEKVW